MQGQRGPKRGFPTLRCDAPGGGRRCDAATLRGAGGAATLRRCDAATLPLGQWRCDAVGAATLRRWSDAATLLALRRCDAGATLRRCWRCDAATLRRGSDAATLLALRRGSDAATLLALRRFLLQECTRRCVAARHGNPHWRSSMNVEVYI